jgi:hypothetical protein
MKERVLAKNRTSATPPQANQGSSPLLHQGQFTEELSESLGSNSNISKELGGIQPKTICRSLNWQNITVEAPSRGNGMSLAGGIQRQQEEPPAVMGSRVSADSAQKSPLELSNSTISTDLPAQKPLIARAPFNGRNIPVEAPSRGNGMSLAGGIQRQQEEPPAVSDSRVSADSVQKSPLESSNSTISTDLPAQKPLIARAPFNGRNIPVEAPSRSSASNTYPGGIQRLETTGVKEQEESTESLQVQPQEAIESKISEGESQEKEEQNKELVQTKLTVGAPGDKYEQEADSMAAKVRTMPDSAIQQPIQRQTGEDTEAVQMQPLVNSITPRVQRESGEEEEVQMKSEVQRASDGSFVASGNVENQLARSKGGGSALPDDVRSFMEPRFGADFSSVRVHTDSNAIQMNKELGAQAFAHGSDIYYGAGKSPGKDELTAHELTHNLQQGGAVRRSTKGSRDEMELSGQSFTEPPAFDPKADYSASDTEYKSSDDEQTGKKKKTRTRAIYNYTKKGQKSKNEDKVDNKVPDGQKGLEKAKSNLNSDATLIHNVIPEEITPKTGKKQGQTIKNESFGATTITTAILHDKKTGAFKKFVFTNLGNAPSPAIRAKAHELGYHVIVTRSSSHAETQMIQYMDARGGSGKYELVSQGVDKPHCIKCDEAMQEYFGEGYPTQQTTSDKTFKKWKQPPRLIKALEKMRKQRETAPKVNAPGTEGETSTAGQPQMATGAATEKDSTDKITDEIKDELEKLSLNSN